MVDRNIGDRMQEQQENFEVIPRKKKASIFVGKPVKKEEETDADKSEE